jgi:hypothetical protein
MSLLFSQLTDLNRRECPVSHKNSFFLKPNKTGALVLIYGNFRLPSLVCWGQREKVFYEIKGSKAQG